ncbi:hypothetical protein Tcan_17442 [Toxocara canis]|uniref:Uncharacterized protein n=1 Tax=Toxocara canis TaxID=6265 RepID=A0A0B2UV38_TOXCA|nr:hypothetical protein Tcan_17442 [Toxocara canis]
MVVSIYKCKFVLAEDIGTSNSTYRNAPLSLRSCNSILSPIGLPALALASNYFPAIADYFGPSKGIVPLTRSCIDPNDCPKAVRG